MDKVMCAPGLAFEAWDPARRCRKTKLGNCIVDSGERPRVTSLATEAEIPFPSMCLGEP